MESIVNLIYFLLGVTVGVIVVSIISAIGFILIYKAIKQQNA